MADQRGMEAEQGGGRVSELRARAEDRLQKQPARPSQDKVGGAEVQGVVHELEVHQVELEMQNEELQRSQAQLEAARAKYFDLYDLAPVGYLTLTSANVIVEANLTASVLLGVERRLLHGQSITDFILSEDQDCYYLCRKRLFDSQMAQRCEMRLVQPNASSPVWVRLDANSAPGGTDSQWRVILSDITEQKRAEEGLQRAQEDLERRVEARTSELATANAALEEDVQRRVRAEDGLRQALGDKEALLREVHHRTKNNLQILCDLLFLQMSGMPEEGGQHVLQDIYGRIYAIARLHEQLYQSLQAGQIRLQPYLQRVMEGVQGVYQNPAVRVEAAAGDLMLDLDRAVHVGLIVNELLTNALKHAFPGGTAGQVTVGLARVGDALELVVRDSGRGLPGNFDLDQARSLGLRIVHILARRLHASVEVGQAGGTSFTLRFPVEAEPPVEPRQA